MTRLIAFVVLCASPLSLFAQDHKPGDTVVVRQPADIRVGNDVVGAARRGDTLDVKAVNGPWLWITKNASGWIKAENVIPLDDAIVYFSQQITRNPNSANARQTRAYLYLGLRKYDEAIADYTAAIRLDPNSAMSFNQRGLARTEKGDYEKAIEDLNRALELRPNDALAYNNRAAAYYRQGKLDKALVDLNAAIQRNDSLPVAYKHRAMIHEEQGDLQQALADFDRAVELNPRDALSRKMRGDAYKSLGEYEKALADFNKSIEFDPKDPIVRNSLAWLLATCPVESLRDGDNAVKHATEACKLTDWQQGICLDTLAAAYAEAGDFQKAVEWQQKALEMAPPEITQQESQQRLKGYQNKKPHREAQPAAPSAS